jgi:hypothetical protein
MSDLSVQSAPPTPSGVAPAEVQALGAAPAKPARRRKNPLVRGLEGLASLRLTVVLFALSLVLVFFGTLAQVDAGIWTVVKQYFRCFYVWIPLQLIVQFGRVFFPAIFSKTMTISGAIPFPGGWTLGFLLLANLLAAHAMRFRVTWKRAGVLVLHFGLILMLVGEFITGVWAIEGGVRIEEGETVNVVQHDRYCELAIVDPSARDVDTVTVIPGRMLRSHEKGAVIRNEELPFDVEVVKWMVNSELGNAGKDASNPASAGAGKLHVAVERPEVAGVATDQGIDLPSVYVKLTDRKGKDLGTYLFSIHLKDQSIQVDGKTYEVALRLKQTYKPYSLELLEFRFDRYPGTDIARNFSSRVRLRDPEYGEDREVVIRMNEPLRHRGDAIFQADWNKKTEKGTVLQVVRNPAWQLPYWSCAIVALGMIFHFGLNLTNFLRRRAG